VIWGTPPSLPSDQPGCQIQDRYEFCEVPQQQLAAEFGVSASTIGDIVTGKAWGWLA
jgi:hypothetical protein